MTLDYTTWLRERRQRQSRDIKDIQEHVLQMMMTQSSWWYLLLSPFRSELPWRSSTLGHSIRRGKVVLISRKIVKRTKQQQQHHTASPMMSHPKWCLIEEDPGFVFKECDIKHVEQNDSEETISSPLPYLLCRLKNNEISSLAFAVFFLDLETTFYCQNTHEKSTQRENCHQLSSPSIFFAVMISAQTEQVQNNINIFVS